MEERIKEIIWNELGANTLKIEEAKGGFSHKMFFLEIDKSPYELLIRFSNPTAKIDADLKTEVWTMEKFTEKGIPVPRVYLFKKRESEGGDDYMLIEKIRGTRLDIIWKEISAEEKKEIVKKIGELIKKMHSIKMEKFGVIREGGKIDSEIPFRFKSAGTKKEHNQALRLTLEGIFEDMARLSSFYHIDGEMVVKWIGFLLKRKKEMEYDGKPTLIHGDIQLGHIFVEKVNGTYEITGVIDFEQAAAKDPHYEFIKLHREGIFDNSELFAKLQEGYGEINKNKVELLRLSRDMRFCQILSESGDNEKAQEIISKINKRIEELS